MGELMTVRDFAESIGAKNGTVKRWVHEGMPVRRSGHVVRVDPAEAQAWIAARPRLYSVTFNRRSVVYFARRDDGAIKIGFTSDVQRRLREIRKEERLTSTPVLLATFDGDKRLELMLHERYARHRIDGEWFHPSEELEALIDCLARGAAA